MKLRDQFLWGAIAALFVILFLYLIPATPKVCEQPDKDGKENCTPYHIPAFLFIETSRTLNDYGSAITALATIAVGIFTGTIYKINRSQLVHANQVERAYISGGGWPERVPWPHGPLTGNFAFTINNYGKTPGELFEYGFGFCDANNVPLQPNYERRHFHDWINPGQRGLPIVKLPIPPNLPDWAVYGRFYYRDIFGARHSCGFIQRGDQPILPPNESFTALRDDWD